MSTATRARWHTHGWNREISWRLMLRILPRVPLPLRPPLHVAFTAICFLAMGRERRSARRNLERVTGKRGAASLCLTWRLFHNFSRFMTAYVDLPPWGNAALEERIAARGLVRAEHGDSEAGGPEEPERVQGGGPGRKESGRERGIAEGGGGAPGGFGEMSSRSGTGLEPVRRALERGRGLILLGMHLGQWDLALVALARAGYKITVVMRREDEEASRVADACRRAAGIRVVHAGESPWLFVDLRSALRNNEVVAMQGDRDMGGRTATVTLFGGRVRIPAGPWELAVRSGAPVFPGALLLRGNGRYEMVWGEPIDAGTAGEAAEGASGPAAIAAAMESLIRRFPDQWFNFYDVWGGGPPGDSPHG